MVPEILRVVICVWGPSEVVDGFPVLLEVLELIGVLKLPAIAMQLLTAFLLGNLFLGRIDLSLFGTTFRLVSTSQGFIVILHNYYCGQIRQDSVLPFPVSGQLE